MSSTDEELLLQFLTDEPLYLLYSIVISISVIIVTTYLIRRKKQKSEAGGGDGGVEPRKGNAEEAATSKARENLPQTHQIMDGNGEVEEMQLKDDDADDETDSDQMDEPSDDEGKWDSSGGLVGKLKSARLKHIEETLTDEQIKTERVLEQEQMAAIFELLRQQEEKFNLGNMGEADVKAQLGLYR